MPKIKVNEINYYYEEAGSKEPLLLIAGLGCDLSIWTSVLDKLSQNFRVIIFDNRDAGRTDYVDATYTINDMADDTVCLIKKLGYEKVSILGHSLGGAIAQDIACRYPEVVDKLIISNSLVQVATVSLAALEFAGKLRKFTTDISLPTQSIAPWIYSDDYLRYDNNLEKLGELIRTYPFPQQADGYLRQLNALAKFNSQGYLHKIRHLTLIIGGSHDLLTPLNQSQIMADNIPNAQLVILPGSHMPIIEIPLLFVKTIDNFLLN
ncbi:MAG: 3-oxoadipate enol-lactonase [Burkholderiales bacterium]|jgi:pimeloyl-ACP methyl ester carboxylesterase|nr:3-oxoadipate enol-lactonase [Burkholderiales bacterium]